MTPLENAILRTLLYADIFNFPLTLDELHRYLIHDRPAERKQIRDTLRQSTRLQTLIWERDGYLGLRDCEAYLSVRKQREQFAQTMWEPAHRYGRLLGNIPFVRMVALTGALAVRNPSATDDDYDYILVTEPGRVWLARLFAVVLVRIVKLRGAILCPNYVLAKNQIIQQQRNLYLAHELVQMVPIYGSELYTEMMQRNDWAAQYLPNAQPYACPADTSNPLKDLMEWFLGGRIGNWLERWEYRRKMRKFHRELTESSQAARIDAEQVKGHFQDHGSPVLQRFAQKQAEYDLLTEVNDSIAQAGD